MEVEGRSFFEVGEDGFSWYSTRGVQDREQGLFIVEMSRKLAQRKKLVEFLYLPSLHLGKVGDEGVGFAIEDFQCKNSDQRVVNPHVADKHVHRNTASDPLYRVRGKFDHQDDFLTIVYRRRPEARFG